MYNQTETPKEITLKLLEKDKKCRDDDPYLYVMVTKRMWISNMTVYQQLSTVSYSSIHRYRQEFQSQFSHLKWISAKDRLKKCADMRKRYSLSYRDKVKKFCIQNSFNLLRK